MTAHARTRAALGLAAALLLGGCMVGPKYNPPDVTPMTMPAWQDLDDPQLSGDPLVDPRWWREAFDDPVLDRLIDEALAQNLSLRSAGLRVLQAQQSLSIAMGKRFPQQQALTGSAQANRLSNNATDHLQLNENEFATYSLGFNLAWELDFWGKYRRMVQQAAAQLDASVDEYDDATVSLIAEVARSYILLRTFQKSLALGRTNLERQSQAVDVARARFEVGDIGQGSLLSFERLLHNTRGSQAGIEQSLQQTKNSLAILLGKLPGEIDALVDEPGPIPSVAPQIAVGMPQNLIRRRPDLRAAERQLAAQAAQTGIAVTELYPQFTIGGSIGSSTNSTDNKAIADLFDGDSVTLGGFFSFKWNIFNYGRIKSNIRLQDARFQQQLVDYRSKVLEVQGEVENAIVAYLKSHQQAESFRLAASAAEQAADITTVQWEDGAIDYIALWMNLSSLYASQSNLASTEGSVATNLVQVYKSLGGGWEVRGGRDPVELLPEETKEEMRARLPSRWNKVLE
jgi:NodT family efflux transporter outer membrane factor (OMF) lipoprotein